MDHSLNKLLIYCDGGARGNPGPAAIGFLVKDSQGRSIYKQAKKIGIATNNIAEYQAVIAALTWIAKQKPEKEDRLVSYNFFLDSRLVVNQLNGNFKVKDKKLKPLIIEVKNLERQSGLTSANKISLFPSGATVSYSLIPRSQNSQADALVNEALDR